MELQELQELQDKDPVLTKDMVRLRKEQARLQEFVDSLFATPSNTDKQNNDDKDTEEDLVASAKSVLPEKAEEVPKPAVSTPEAPTPVENTEMIPTDAKPEAVTVQTQVQDKEVEPVKPDDEIQEQPAKPAPTSEPEKVQIDPPTDPRPEAAEAEILAEAAEAKPVVPVEVKKVPAEPVQVPEEAPTKPELAAPSGNTAASSSADSSKKQTPKKKKKRNGKNAS